MSGASITANTIPASAINGGINVVLSSDTMSARTATQIGYTIKSTTLLNAIGGPGANDYVAKITGLGPIGSVWIVNAGIQFAPDFKKVDLYQWFVQRQSTFDAGQSGLNAAINVTGGYRGYQAASSNVVEFFIWESSTGVYTVPDSTGSTLILGFYSNTFGANQNSLSGVSLSATRIA